MRYAIYFAPAQSAPLMEEASAWLGRDVFTGQDVAHPPSAVLSTEAIAEITSSPRRYGFHATLKAPFHLADGQTEEGLVAAFDRFVSMRRSFHVPDIAVGNLSGFFALMPREPSHALSTLAGEAVTAFEPFRAPLAAEDIARRKPEHLSPAEAANLFDWGYPYVFESFRFHMTLTNRIAFDQRDVIEAELNRLFEPVLPNPLSIDGIAIYVEPEPGAPFTILRHATLAPRQDRKSA